MSPVPVRGQYRVHRRPAHRAQHKIRFTFKLPPNPSLSVPLSGNHGLTCGVAPIGCAYISVTVAPVGALGCAFLPRLVNPAGAVAPGANAKLVSQPAAVRRVLAGVPRGFQPSMAAKVSDRVLDLPPAVAGSLADGYLGRGEFAGSTAVT